MKGEAKFIGITSGCGGVGTSSLALVLGRSLSRFFNKKVLFLSFDLLASKSPTEGGASRKDFFNYYQKLISDSEESEGSLSDFIVSDGNIRVLDKRKGHFYDRSTCCKGSAY